MAIKKSELYSSLWSSCDELRGGMDASQYKDYVLVMLFIKYVSDKYADVPYAPITIPQGASFRDMVALKGKTDIGDQINKKIIAPLANANKLSDMPDFNDPGKLGSGQEIVERLTNLIGIFENKALDFSKNRAEGDDILGDAYEYLMRHFATESGKSKGQFYTPAEVSRVMAQIIGIRDAHTTNNTTVYDPTCGSGSLLLKVGDEAKAEVTLYGQEKDTATSGLARMNMILHNKPTALIKGGHSTLANPLYTGEDGKLKTFDYVVANPPFSDKRWSTGIDPLNDPHERFQHYGTPPPKQGDYAYLLHIIRSLKSTGKGACILPHGVLFRGNAEADIRRNLIRRGYIKGIIGLPANLFYGTGIPACIVVIDKENAHSRKGIFMLDASKGYLKDGNKNRLRDCDIHKIVDVFNRRDDSDPSYARMVGNDEIEKNEFNLNIPRYIDSQQAEDLQDITGHLQGGIPQADVEALHAYWDVCPNLKATLFKPAAGNAAILAAGGLEARASSNVPSPRGWHSRGYLPHIDGPNLLQFITFRMADSVPSEQIELWKQELKWREGLDADSPESAALRKKIENYADAGHGACHLRVPRVAQMVQDALLHFDGQRYRMIAWCIMPNHVHTLIEPIDAAHSLPSIIHSWKSFTANAANKMLSRTGAFWMEDYFDRYIRDETHLQATLDYIRQNPVKARLVQRAEDWPWAGNAGFQPACGQDGRAPGYLDLAVPKQAIKSAIYEHPEFVTFIASMNALFASWRGQSAVALKTLEAGFHPKDLIMQMSESLLAFYTGKLLIDKYDVYQHLMDYWAATMQDDCYLIADDGWKAATCRIVEKDKKGKEKDKGWACDLVPKQIIVDRYFAAQQQAIRELEATLESVAAQLAELEEEHGGEEGAYAELDKVNKANVSARLKELGTRASSPHAAKMAALPDDEAEIAALDAWRKLNEQESEIKKSLKEEEAELDALAYAKYPKLSEAEIKILVVDDRWLAALNKDIHGEMDRISHALTRRVKELAERYETPLPKL